MMNNDTQIHKIQQEIAAMFQTDQDYRNNHKLGDEWDDSMDKKHTARLKEIIKEIGFPSKSVVGEEAYGKMWFIIQHADHDVEFQKQCLKTMQSLPPQEIHPLHVAFLSDRVLVNSGAKQLYGSQFHTDKDGNFGPRPIQDPDNVEKRRAEMGLQSLEEYRQLMLDLNSKT